MIYSIVAIMAVMAASCLFGYTMHGVIDRAHNNLVEEEDQAGHDCNTCRYGETKSKEEPCFTCLTQDVDMWEAKG